MDAKYKKSLDVHWTHVIIFMFSLSTTALCSIHGGEFHIVARGGVITVTGEDNCTLKFPDGSETLWTPESKYVYFGLIDYTCGAHNGQLISTTDCQECQLYCPINDHLEGCQHKILTGILGGSIGLLVGFLFGYTFVFLIKYLKARIATLRSARTAKKVDFYMSELESRTRPKTVTRTNSSNSINSITSFGMRALAFLGGVNACDRTLYMSSSGLVCELGVCKTISSYSFPMQTGSTTCFRVGGGEMIEMTIDITRVIYKYSLMYKTSDVELEVESHSRCKQADDCDKDHCFPGAVSNYFNMTKPKERLGIVGHSCEAEGLGCDFTCWHKYACTWYRWTIVPVGSMEQVYKKSYSIWDMRVKTKYSNSTTITKLNANNPQGSIYIPTNPPIMMPVIVDNIVHETISISDWIMSVGDGYMSVDASSTNFPVSGQVGDVQISIGEEMIKYPIHAVKCQTVGCKPTCNIPEPSVRTIRLMPKNTRGMIFTSNTDSLIVSKMTNVQARFSIGDIDIKNLYIETAKCDFDIIDTYGCTGCDMQAYAIFQSHAIESPGLLQFESNCTFKRNYISCSDNKGTLVLEEYAEYCNIYVKAINKTVDIQFRYAFLGGLTKSYLEYSKYTSVSDQAWALVSNKSFIDSMYTSFIIISSFTILAKVITQVLIRVTQAKTIDRSIAKV